MKALRRITVVTRISITFEGPGIDAEHGVSLEDFQRTVDHLHRAFRFTIADLMGADISQGRPPDAVRDQGALRLVATSPGSLVAHFDIGPALEGQMPMDDLSGEAVMALLESEGDSVARMPQAAADEIRLLSERLSSDISAVSLAGVESGKKLRVSRTVANRTTQASEEVDATLYGWLREVNWAKGTAQLHDYLGDGYINLAFGGTLALTMRQLATESVRVKGKGQFDRDGSWSKFTVSEVTAASGRHGPFSMKAFGENPSPKIFGVGPPPPQIRLTEEEFDSFVNAIKEGRKA